MKKIPYGRQNITEEDIQAVVDVLRSDFLTQGPQIVRFENEFAEYIGVKHAVAVSNGTAALHLCTMALGVMEGDKVITTPITFAASANCIMYAGGEVVFADIDPVTYLIDIKEVKRILESDKEHKVKGIIPVDFSGRPVNLEAFRELADKYGCWIIEDACHAPGGFYIDKSGNKQFCGNGEFADLSVFSFHPVKHIATGEGGMITTNNESLYRKLQLLRSHGITREKGLMIDNHGDWYYEMQELGFNYRLTDFQSALGISQLKKAEAGLIRRKEIAEFYNNSFNGEKYVKGQTGIIDGHAYHLYIIEVDERKALFDYLRENNIYAQVHYIPVHLMPYYRQFGWKKGDFPHAENYYCRCISLPIYPTLTDSEQSYVIERIISFLKNK